MTTPDLTQVASSILPSFSANVILYIIISVVVLALLGWGFWGLFKRMKYNLTFVIYKDVAGKPQVIDRCKGMEILLGNTGERAFFIKKYNKYLPLGNLQMGVRVYNYYIDKAGHWHNFDISHIDVNKRDAQLNMQIEMDYARDGMNKRLEDRKTKESWWASHGWQLVAGTFILIIVVFAWLAFRDALNSSSVSQQNLQAQSKLEDSIMTKYTTVLTALDNVCSGKHIDVGALNLTS